MRSPAATSHRCASHAKGDHYRSRPERPRPYATPAHRAWPLQVSRRRPRWAHARHHRRAPARRAAACPPTRRPQAPQEAGAGAGSPLPHTPSNALTCVWAQFSPVALHAAVQSTSTPVHAAGSTSPALLPGPLCSHRPTADPGPREGRCRAPGPLQELRGRYLPLSPAAWSPRPASARSGRGEPDAA